jgi:hypothetical protein
VMTIRVRRAPRTSRSTKLRIARPDEQTGRRQKTPTTHPAGRWQYVQLVFDRSPERARLCGRRTKAAPSARVRATLECWRGPRARSFANLAILGSATHLTAAALLTALKASGNTLPHTNRRPECRSVGVSPRCRPGSRLAAFFQPPRQRRLQPSTRCRLTTPGVAAGHRKACEPTPFERLRTDVTTGMSVSTSRGRLSTITRTAPDTHKRYP